VPSQPRSPAAGVARHVFPATPGKVQEIVSFVTDLAAKAGLPAEKVSRLDLAIEEWATNVCRYAYRGGHGTVWVAVRRDGPTLVVELSDEGNPFDPTTAAEPDVSLALRERSPGGLGLLLMRRMVDELSYRREGHCNIVTLAVRS
jgi:serine/threonine-protein kinase RsbW